MSKITIRCGDCGSADVLRDAYAVWDDAGQAWILSTVFDASFCVACENDARLVEQPLVEVCCDVPCDRIPARS